MVILAQPDGMGNAKNKNVEGFHKGGAWGFVGRHCLSTETQNPLFSRTPPNFPKLLRRYQIFLSAEGKGGQPRDIRPDAEQPAGERILCQLSRIHFFPRSGNV